MTTEQQTTATETEVPFLKPVKDDPDYPKDMGTFTLLEVLSATENLSIGSGGHAVPANRKVRILVPTKDVKLWISATRTAEDSQNIDAAAAQHERDFKKDLGELLRRLSEEGFAPESVESQLEQSKFTKQWTGSKERSFHRAWSASPKPVLECTIIAENLGNPSLQAKLDADEAAQIPMAKAIAQALAAQSATINADALKQIEALQKQVAQLLAAKK